MIASSTHMEAQLFQDSPFLSSLLECSIAEMIASKEFSNNIYLYLCPAPPKPSHFPGGSVIKLYMYVNILYVYTSFCLIFCIYPQSFSYRYIGKWHQGKRHGYGKYVFPNGDVFEGEWKMDVRNGKGKITYINDHSVYVGDWKNGKKDGQGVYKFKNGAQYHGKYTQHTYMQKYIQTDRYDKYINTCRHTYIQTNKQTDIYRFRDTCIDTDIIALIYPTFKRGMYTICTDAFYISTLTLSIFSRFLL